MLPNLRQTFVNFLRQQAALHFRIFPWEERWGPWQLAQVPQLSQEKSGAPRVRLEVGPTDGNQAVQLLLQVLGRGKFPPDSDDSETIAT